MVASLAMIAGVVSLSIIISFVGDGMRHAREESRGDGEGGGSTRTAEVPLKPLLAVPGVGASFSSCESEIAIRLRAIEAKLAGLDRLEELLQRHQVARSSPPLP